MTMPVMEPDLDAEVLWDWAQEIDDGPFSSLCWGERMAFDNPETLTLMGALAAWTDRVRLVTTVMVPQLHDPVMLAKAGVTDRVTGRQCVILVRHTMRGRRCGGAKTPGHKTPFTSLSGCHLWLSRPFPALRTGRGRSPHPR